VWQRGVMPQLYRRARRDPDVDYGDDVLMSLTSPTFADDEDVPATTMSPPSSVSTDILNPVPLPLIPLSISTSFSISPPPLGRGCLANGWAGLPRLRRRGGDAVALPRVWRWGGAAANLTAGRG
jgi:hypothetical protein